MARRIEQSFRGFEDVNLLLFSAWEHGARHVALCPEPTGIEIRYLGTEGAEHVEHLSLSYLETVKRLRQMSARLGRVHVNMGGHQWIVDAVVPATRRATPSPTFLHMRPEED